MENVTWRQEGIIITNGHRKLCIGEVVGYKAKGLKHINKWIVSGVTEHGKLILKPYIHTWDKKSVHKLVVHLDNDRELLSIDNC